MDDMDDIFDYIESLDDNAVIEDLSPVYTIEDE